MLKTAAAILISAALMFSAPAFAVDGQVLINQSTVIAAGGFPYKITQPGSYKLSSNLVAPVGANGIEIHSSNVTIDLNGFTISGPVTCTGGGSSITCTGGPVTGIAQDGIRTPSFTNFAGLTVRNGSVEGFSYGIDVEGSNILIEEIHAYSNQRDGMYVRYGAVVRRNTVSGNFLHGLVIFYSTTTENVANDNGQNGLAVAGGVFGSNTLDGNASGGVLNIGGVSQNNNDCDGTAC